MRSPALMTHASELKRGEPTTTRFARIAPWGNWRRTNSGNCINPKARQLTFEWCTRRGKVSRINTDAAAVEMTNYQSFKLRIIHASCQNKCANEGGEAEHADADPSASRPTDADEHRHQCCPSEHRRHIYSVQPSPDLWLKTVQDSAIGDIADS